MGTGDQRKHATARRVQRLGAAKTDGWFLDDLSRWRALVVLPPPLLGKTLGQAHTAGTSARAARHQCKQGAVVIGGPAVQPIIDGCNSQCQVQVVLRVLLRVSSVSLHNGAMLPKKGYGKHGHRASKQRHVMRVQRSQADEAFEVATDTAPALHGLRTRPALLAAVLQWLDADSLLQLTAASSAWRLACTTHAPVLDCAGHVLASAAACRTLVQCIRRYTSAQDLRLRLRAFERDLRMASRGREGDRAGVVTARQGRTWACSGCGMVNAIVLSRCAACSEEQRLVVFATGDGAPAHPITTARQLFELIAATRPELSALHVLASDVVTSSYVTDALHPLMGALAELHIVECVNLRVRAAGGSSSRACLLFVRLPPWLTTTPIAVPIFTHST